MIIFKTAQNISLSYRIGSDMNCSDIILDCVSVAHLDEVNLSDMVVSGVIFPEFTSLLW